MGMTGMGPGGGGLRPGIPLTGNCDAAVDESRFNVYSVPDDVLSIATMSAAQISEQVCVRMRNVSVSLCVCACNMYLRMC